jgi:hypothetical protein
MNRMSSNTTDPHKAERDATRTRFFDSYKRVYAYVIETEEGILDEEGRMTYWPWILRNRRVNGPVLPNSQPNLRVNNAPPRPSSPEERRAAQLAALARRGLGGGTRKRQQRRVRNRSQRAY